MEPLTDIKRQHLQVVSDLRNLMKKAQDEKGSEKQRLMKERMLKDLLENSRTFDFDDLQDRKPNMKLSVNEVADIVTHINLCEQTNTPIRWDLINDIVFPNGMEGENNIENDNGEAPAHPALVCCDNNYFQDPHNLVLQATIDPLISKVSKDVVPDRNEVAYSILNDMAQEEDPIETFRRQYDLTEDEMADVIAHLKLCEETNTEVRWDLINRIIYPDDNLSLPMAELIGADHDECRSAVTEGFDDASGASWFSIYPEFDDCASSVTFLIDGDEIKAGKKSKRTSQESARDSIQSSDALKHEDSQRSDQKTETLEEYARPPTLPMPSPTLPHKESRERRMSAIRASAVLAKTTTANNNSRPDPLLRKRVEALRESTHHRRQSFKAPTPAKSGLVPPSTVSKTLAKEKVNDSAWIAGQERSNLMDILASMDLTSKPETACKAAKSSSEDHDEHDSVPSMFDDQSTPSIYEE